VCEKGYGKRTSLEDYRPQKRGGLGLINIKTTARNGKVVALKAVDDKDEVMMITAKITAKGMIVRTGLDEVRAIGRNTAGVRMIKLKAGDKLVAVERLVIEDDEPEATETAGKAEGLSLEEKRKVTKRKKKSPKPN
jgi:DNA gyrase subunit A